MRNLAASGCRYVPGPSPTPPMAAAWLRCGKAKDLGRKLVMAAAGHELKGRHVARAADAARAHEAAASHNIRSSAVAWWLPAVASRAGERATPISAVAQRPRRCMRRVRDKSRDAVGAPSTSTANSSHSRVRGAGSARGAWADACVRRARTDGANPARDRPAPVGADLSLRVAPPARKTAPLLSTLTRLFVDTVHSFYAKRAASACGVSASAANASNKKL